MEIKIEHNLNKKELISRMQTLFEQMKKEYSGKFHIKEEKWEHDKVLLEGSVKGFKLKAIGEISERVIKFDFKLPLMLKMFETQIKEELVKEFKKRILY